MTALALCFFSPVFAAGWTDGDSLKTCRALALSDPSQCAGAHPLCGHFYLQGVFAKERTQKACEAMLASEHGAIAAPAGAKACAALVRRKPAKACAILRAEVKDTPSFSLKTCDDDFRMFLGEPGVCAKMPADAQDFCRGVAALRRKKKDLCLAEPYCRALTEGGGGACAAIDIRNQEKPR